MVIHGSDEDYPLERTRRHRVTRETLAAELEAAIPIDDIPEAQADRDKKLMALLKHKPQN